MGRSIRDNNGKLLALGHRLGAGGEGSVYELAEYRDMVAKVYHKPIAPEKAEKLSGMVRRANPQLVKFAAWPRGTLHTERGETIGIILPRITEAREIHELYSPAQRKVYFPNANWLFLLHVARNCAAAFHSVHAQGIVIGDVNQGNVFVSNKALVSLIDCDSFQFSENGKVHLCRVGVPHFTPPELQTAQLSRIVRTTNHDCFGLAILIFHLLFMGRHPFAGRHTGKEDMPIERAIRELRFAYGPDAKRHAMEPPPYTLRWDEVPPTIRQLFEKAFSPSVRPSAQQWASTLDGLKKNVARCQNDPGHIYLPTGPYCPWCRIAQGGGPNFFISVTAKILTRPGTVVDIAVIWNEIEQIAAPKQIIGRLRPPPLPPVPGTPVPENLKQQRFIERLLGWVSLAGFGFALLALLFSSALLVTGLLTGAVFALIWVYCRSNSPLAQVRSERQFSLLSAESKLKEAEDEYERTIDMHEQRFRSTKERVRQIKSTLDGLGREYKEAIESLKRNAQQKQLDQHLDQFFICRAQISGVGDSRLALLESYGIETALDVSEEAILKIRGFGPKLTGNLLEWKRNHERTFRFDPAKGVPQADLQALQVSYYQKRLQMERILQYGPTELKQLLSACKAYALQQCAAISRLEAEAAQATEDLRALGA